MKLTRYGIREIIIATVLCWGLVAMAVYWAGRAGWPVLFGSAVAILVWLWVLWFFRDPERTIPTGAGLFVSPADGLVADITPLGPDGPLGRPGLQIGIFMNVFNVHVNRMPCEATIQRITHRPGTFMDVRDPVAAERNESATIELTYSHGGMDYPIIVRQIAGLVARRIVTDCRAGLGFSRGERFGMIKFGSRLELLLPSELAGEICVETGQRVRAGATILAKV
jgi:phosphatidylserine decarboxylase